MTSNSAALRSKSSSQSQPILAHFELAPEKEDDRAAQAQILATLAAAGFKPSAEVVSEMMGFEVSEAQPPQAPGLPLLNSAARGVITNSAASPPAQDSLSAAELSALQALACGSLSAAGLQSAGSAMEEALQGAITNSEECRAKDPSKCRVHGENDRQEREMDRSSMESAGYSKEEIERVLGKEPRQRMTDAQAADVKAFKKDRKNIKASIKQSIPEHGGLELDMAEPELKGTVLTRNAIGEMLSDKAVRASVLNGCPTAAHVEAVSRASELAPEAKKVGEEPGRKENDRVEKITHLEKTFTAKDGNEYIAHFTAHHPKPNPRQPNKPAAPPKLYFLYLRK